jgi:ubiquinone/menaquinone biosynthesis C-methylase UbiE
MTTTIEISELKVAHRAMWDSGDYAAVARDLVLEVAEAAVDAAAPQPGDEILDVATGSGNAAIPAALAGARVTGLDLSPVLLDAARRRGEDAGAEVEWVEGDAEALPYPAASFDKVMSVIGVQFAPRHEVAARELARVLRPAGTLVVCSWTPTGFIGQFLKVVAPRLPKPPEGASPPPLWGDENHVRALFEESEIEFEFERRAVRFEQASAQEFIAYMARNYGPLVKARERLELEGRWEELRADLVAFCERSSESADRFVTDSEYLLARGRKR